MMFERYKQQVDEALLRFEAEMSRVNQHLAQDQQSDVTALIVTLHQRATDYFARQETLFENLEMNKANLTPFWSEYLQREPQKELKIVIFGYLEMITGALASGRLNATYWRTIFPEPSEYFDITRRLAWASMSNAQRVSIVAKFNTIKIRFREFVDFEDNLWLLLPRNLREVIKEVCPTDGSLDAFILDYFLDVYSKLSRAMERDEKINVLFSCRNSDEIIFALKASTPSEHLERFVNRVKKRLSH